jgi:predicted nucleic acid-binding protein
VKFVVDHTVVVQLANESYEVPAEHELLAPTLLRSQMLWALHESVQGGGLDRELGRELLERSWKLPIRFLGDAVLRRLAWELADQLEWASTYDAEYLALTRLQADAFVTLNPELARRAEDVVPVATIDALR